METLQPTQFVLSTEIEENRFQDFRFLVSALKGEPINLSGELQYAEGVTEYLQTVTDISTDYDHTISDKGPSLERIDLTDNDGREVFHGRMDIENHSPEERENIDLLIACAIMGKPVSIITGKEVNIWPTASFIQKRIYQTAELLGLDRYEDGRLKTLDGKKPLIFGFAVNNGGEMVDLLSLTDKKIAFFQIGERFWQAMKDESLDTLLRQSTTDSRKRQLARVTPQYQKSEARLQEIYELYSPHHYLNGSTPAAVSTCMGDYAYISPNHTKVGLEIDVKRIRETPQLQRRWWEITNITVVDHPSFYEALDEVFRRKFGDDESSWPVKFFPSYANGFQRIDINDPRANKAKASDCLFEYANKVYQDYDAEIIQDRNPLGMGDAPSGNDAPMLKRRGGFTCSVKSDRSKSPDGSPVYLQDFDQSQQFTEIQLTRRFLADLLVAQKAAEV